MDLRVDPSCSFSHFAAYLIPNRIRERSLLDDLAGQRKADWRKHQRATSSHCLPKFRECKTTARSQYVQIAEKIAGLLIVLGTANSKARSLCHAVRPSPIRTLTVGFGFEPNPPLACAGKTGRGLGRIAIPPVVSFTLPRRSLRTFYTLHFSKVSAKRK